MGADVSKNIFGIVILCGLCLLIGAGAIYLDDRLPVGSLGFQIAEAKRHSIAAIGALDSALERSGRIADRLGRIKELAFGIQECASELTIIIGLGASGSEEKKP